MTGKIAYNQQFDVVYFDLNGEIKTLSAHMLTGFMLQEPRSDLRHIFKTYPEKMPTGYEKERFFELIITGYNDVVRISAHSTVLEIDKQTQSTGILQTVDESRYFFYSKGDLIEIKKFKRQIFEVFPVPSNEIKDLIDEEELDLRDREDQLKLVRLLNSVMAADPG